MAASEPGESGAGGTWPLPAPRAGASSSRRYGASSRSVNVTNTTRIGVSACRSSQSRTVAVAMSAAWFYGNPNTPVLTQHSPMLRLPARAAASRQLR